jgi:phage-related protein
VENEMASWCCVAADDVVNAFKKKAKLMDEKKFIKLHLQNLSIPHNVIGDFGVLKS